MFMPATYELLQNLMIVSARDMYEEAYPNQMELWKYYAFMMVKYRATGAAITNLMVIGDSNFEMMAAENLARHFPIS